MSVQLTYNGSYPRYSMDIMLAEGQQIRTDLLRGVAKTIEGYSIYQLAGRPEWEAILASSDFTLTLSDSDAQSVVFPKVITAGSSGVAGEVTILSAMPWGGQITSIRAVIGTVASSKVWVVRDSNGAYATLTIGTSTATIVLTAKRPGAYGDEISFEIIDSGGLGPATCSVSTKAITVDLVGLTKTAAQIKTLIEATSAAAALVSVTTPIGSGAGNVAIFTEENLDGGDDGVDLSADMSTTSAVEVLGTLVGKTVAKGDPLVLYAQDRAAAGEVFVTVKQTTN